MAKWIKQPGPGQYRGEGVWTKVDENDSSALMEYEYCEGSKYLPTHEGDAPPDQNISS